MSFKSLNRSIQKWEERPELQQLQLFRQILTHWQDVVGVPVAKHSRPHALNRGVLFVAASSSTWAQNLTLQRQRILTKLNPLLAEPISEMRFSTAQWQNRLVDETNPSSSIATKPDPIVPDLSDVSDPVTAFTQWAEVVQKRSQHLPICSQCQCPTPIIEIERWGICALCRAKELKGF